MKTSIKLLLLSLLFIFSNCSAQSKKDGKINTKINGEYAKSRKDFYGKLNSNEYTEIRKLIETELKVEIPENKTILINYFQNGANCSEYKLNSKSGNGVIDNYVQLSSEISSRNNAFDFFVYSDNALNKDRFENREIFILDKGFFSQSFFTLKENCRAFFVLKPNGDFMKHYGGDYYSIIEKFLQKE